MFSLYIPLCSSSESILNDHLICRINYSFIKMGGLGSLQVTILSWRQRDPKDTAEHTLDAKGLSQCYPCSVVFIRAPKCQGNFSNINQTQLLIFYLATSLSCCMEPVKLSVEEQLLPAQPENEDPSNQAYALPVCMVLGF